MARAAVIAGSKRTDYLPAKDLVIPATFIDGLHRDFLVPLSDSVHRRDAVSDIAVNFIIFLPIGFLYAASLPWRPALTGILICLGLSLSVESGQLFLVDRITSCVDLIVNTMAGAVGAIAATSLTASGEHQRGTDDTG